mmetsp:Transcript_36/g.61  ORF Transcript_36/g.61 Transcript_36/m.61 type:complete len:211 (-) Transcript_36:106-738(-)
MGNDGIKGEKTDKRRGCFGYLCAWFLSMLRFGKDGRGNSANRLQDGTSLTNGKNSGIDENSGLLRNSGDSESYYSVEASAVALEARFKPLLESTSELFIDVMQVHSLRLASPRALNGSAASYLKTEAEVSDEKLNSLLRIINSHNSEFKSSAGAANSPNSRLVDSSAQENLQSSEELSRSVAMSSQGVLSSAFEEACKGLVVPLSVEQST